LKIDAEKIPGLEKKARGSRKRARGFGKGSPEIQNRQSRDSE
jgi:hypothetical protein